MVVMAQEYGADVRLVALMQYLRVLFVAGRRRWWYVLPGRRCAGADPADRLVSAIDVAAAVDAAADDGCGMAGAEDAFPVRRDVIPDAGGRGGAGEGWWMLELPEWLLALAYAAIGWSVGLKFNKEIFLLALKTRRRLSPPLSA